MGFTGLAVAGGYETRPTLRDAIERGVKQSADIRVMMATVRQVLSDAFKRRPVLNIREKHKPLMIGLTGAVIVEVDGQRVSQAVYGVISSVEPATGQYLGDFGMSLERVAQGMSVFGPVSSRDASGPG